MEAQAWNALVEDGCVPCYPVGLGFPLPEHVGTYQGVVSYWKRYGWADRRVLCSQLRDWQIFRNFQAKNRRYILQRNTFAAFQDNVSDRRRRHKLEGDASLHPDPEQQRPLDDWIEYHDYHLMIREGLEQTIKSDEEMLASVQEEADGIRTPGSKMSHHLKVFPYRIDRHTCKKKQHEGLLQWIEQQRLAMVAEEHGGKIATKDDDRQCDAPKSVRKASDRKSLTKKPKAVSVLSAVASRISKKVPQQRNLRPRKRDMMRKADRAATTENSVPRDPSKSRGNKNERQRSTAESPHPMPQKRDSKAAKRLRSKRLDISQPPQQSAPIMNRTRCGRVFKKPNRFGFG
ncbi:MAG: hypothetical protein Q9188_004036 [Gyalolechia gomerana]